MPSQIQPQTYQEIKLRRVYHWIFLIIIIYLLGALFYADPLHISEGFE